MRNVTRTVTRVVPVSVFHMLACYMRDGLVLACYPEERKTGRFLRVRS